MTYGPDKAQELGGRLSFHLLHTRCERPSKLATAPPICVMSSRRLMCSPQAEDRLKLYSRPGNDLTYRFPLIVEAIAKLRSRSCIIDGEAVACGEDGIASFDRIRYRHNDDGVFLYAFDLIELDGDDLRRNPLIVRKTTLGSLLSRAALGLRLNEHLEADGPDVFHHACKLGLEGIVSKRKDSRYRSGRSPDWIKSKNPDAPAVKREAEEEWGRWSAAKPRPSSR
jgi:bifunctional non-homologous end joining protein LigD